MMVDPELYVSDLARLRAQAIIHALADLVLAFCAIATAAGLGIVVAWIMVGRP